MNILGDIYENSLHESEKNIKFWEEYLQNLNSLDFSVYSDKLSVPILVPIGNKILFRGSLKHTNEVTVALGADYFTKCSVKQAEVLRLHRIKGAKSKLETLHKEKDYLESQILFSKGIFQDDQCQDIVEECNEDEDKAWRERHREKVRAYYQNKNKREVEKSSITDEELWLRLEELELQEELQNEMDHDGNEQELDDSDKNEYDSFIIKKDGVSNSQALKINETQDEPQITHNFPKNTSNVNLLLQVIDRQKMLEEKLTDLKNRERVETKTESDLLSRLDEMEQLDELEDEIDRLDEIIQEDDEVMDEYVESEDNLTKMKRSVSFADQYDCKTIEINFKHSNVEGSKDPYVVENGITKPSDLYKAYSTLFDNGTSSILKKSKYNDSPVDNFYETETTVPTDMPQYSSHEHDAKVIVVKDVIERSNSNENNVQYEPRPTSLFKKKRQQQKF